MDEQIQTLIEDYSLNYSNIAVYGLIKLQIRTYLVLIVNSQLIGNLLNHQIYLIKQLAFLPYSSNESVAPQDQVYIEMIKQSICNDSCYYSPTSNLSHSLQSKKDRNRFVINHKCLANLKNKTYVINGHVQIYQQSQITYCQIVRRETLRQGRRFTQRGCDREGNCTNYAEIEDIYISNKQAYSFIQIRGSIPFKWSQQSTLKFKPDIIIEGSIEQNTELCNLHLYNQLANYRQLFILNLIDKKGKQQVLGNYFQQILEEFQRREVSYYWFDFHKEKGNIEQLLAETSSVLESYEYYQQTIEGKIISEQKGVFRVNCMSCIDRSNIVQNFFSKFILNQIFQDVRLVDSLEFIHNLFWINTGDQLSRLYSGTTALKSDYITVGKRTWQGLFNDSFLSTKRYFLNFNDYHIQNSLDLTLGLWNMNDVKFHNYKYKNSLLRLLLYFLLFTLLFNQINFGIFSPILPVVILYYLPQLYVIKPILVQ